MLRATTLVFALTIVAYGQHDLSFWSKNSTVYPWYLYTGKKMTIDARYNFDALHTGAVCIGKKFETESFTFVPEACGLAGKTNGYGPELLILADKNGYSLFNQNQFVKGAGNASFAYHWVDALRRVNKRVWIGIGEQYFKEFADDAPGQFDIGPSTKLALGKAYLKVWPVWSVGPADPGKFTLFLTIGYSW